MNVETSFANVWILGLFCVSNPFFHPKFIEVCFNAAEKTKSELGS